MKSNNTESKAGRLSVLERRLGMAVFTITCIVFLPATTCSFVNWDDLYVLAENPVLHRLNLETVKWSFTSFMGGNWLPLTWLSHAMDFQLFGQNAGLHHATNILFHALTACMVFLLVRDLLDCLSECKRDEFEDLRDAGPAIVCLAALLFAVHPLRVESVAWMTERKDLLCGLFYFWSLRLYLAYATDQQKKIRRLGWCFLVFLLGLLSKPMAVTLPVVLLLLDLWPLGRLHKDFRRTCIEKIPFFLASLCIGLITIKAQGAAGAFQSVERNPISFRVMNACHSLMFYIWESILPLNLVSYHPIIDPAGSAFTPGNILAALLVVGISVGCAWLWSKGKQALPVVWAYYVLSIAPVLGLTQVGAQAFADRYTYIPCLSFTLFAAVVVIRFIRSIQTGLRRSLACGGVIVWLGILGGLTFRQIFVWENSFTLWSHVAGYYPNHEFPLDGIASAYLCMTPGLEPHQKEAALEEARSLLNRALKINPAFAPAYGNLWSVYRLKGMYEEALEIALRLVDLRPDKPESHHKLGVSYSLLGRHADAEESLRHAIQIGGPDDAILGSLAMSYKASGQLSKAIESYQRALVISPYNVRILLDLSSVLAEKKLPEEALKYSSRAIQIAPENPFTYLRQGEALRALNRIEEARRLFENAAKIAPGLPEVTKALESVTN
ncbi:MAG: tetratricopeptide repeat protein [Planctomycetota bacterium]|nr:tetratricopeptide repeat protein [Planctomycetota bacterium]MDA1138244.1 tetratricopeptide repeat protein [Planctomycetota bacterium]